MDTVAQFAKRVNSASMGLMISPELIRAAFIKGLPTRLQTYAYGINGTYDDLVGAVGNISGILNRSLRTGESIREVREDKHDKKKAGTNQKRMRILLVRREEMSDPDYRMKNRKGQ